MTKQEVAAKVAEKTNIGQHQAVKVIETVMEVITEAVCGGNEVTLRGFGTFKRSFVEQRRPETSAVEKLSRCRKPRSRFSNPARTSFRESATESPERPGSSGALITQKEMDKALFQEYPEDVRRQMLEDNCDRIEEVGYMKPFTGEQLPRNERPAVRPFHRNQRH